MSQRHSHLTLVVAMALVLSACAAPAAAPTTAPADTAAPATSAPVATAAPTFTAAPTVDAGATQTAAAAAAQKQMATAVAATLTAQPTATVPPTTTPTQAPSPTATKPPTAAPSATHPRPTAAATAAATQPPAATDVPAPAAGPLYSNATGGPQGYLSTLVCSQPGGAECQSVMAAGDKSFSIVLESTQDALLAIFVPFGLAVEKDGANVPNMYMTVDTGWLHPGGRADMGTSWRFSQPGHYVIRTNGCLITEQSYPACTWWTVNGTIVTFDIQ